MNWDSYKNSIDRLPRNPNFTMETMKKIESCSKNKPKFYTPIVCTGVVAAAACLAVVAVAPRFLKNGGAPGLPPAQSAEGTSKESITTEDSEPTTEKTESASSQTGSTEPEKEIYTVNLPMDFIGPTDIPSVVELSKAVVRGRVTEVSYVVVDGSAWSRVTIQAEYVYKGNIANGETLTFYQNGGYMTMEDYLTGIGEESRLEQMTDDEKSRIVKQTYGNEPLPIVRDENVYCLVETAPYSPLPEGAYELYPFGKLKIVDDGNTFEQNIMGTTPSRYTHDEISLFSE